MRLSSFFQGVIQCSLPALLFLSADQCLDRGSPLVQVFKPFQCGGFDFRPGGVVIGLLRCWIACDASFAANACIPGGEQVGAGAQGSGSLAFPCQVCQRRFEDLEADLSGVFVRRET